MNSFYLYSFDICIVALLLILIIYWYLTRNFDYWTKRGIKGPKPYIIFGTAFESLTKSISELDLANQKKYGKIYGLFNGSSPFLSVADPEIINNICVRDTNLLMDQGGVFGFLPVDKTLSALKGKHWKHVRSIVSPTFAKGKMKKMHPMFTQCLIDLVDYMCTFANKNKSLNVKTALSYFTIDAIITCAFSTKINPYKDENNIFLKNAYEGLNFTPLKVLYILLLPVYVVKFIFNLQYYRNPIDFYFTFIKQLLKERKRNSNKNFNDFLQLLLDAKKDSQNVTDVIENNDGVNADKEDVSEPTLTLNKNFQNKYLTEEEVLHQAWIIIAAPYETTTNFLSFALYELALNPEVQENLYNKLMAVLDTEEEFSYEVLENLPLLDAFICETLRVHSPVLRFQRICTTDEYSVGNTGIKIFKDQVIQVPVTAVHHSEEFYPNPEKFIPERFLPENRHNIKPYSYIPFGAGPRSCVGQQFALMEGKACIAKLVTTFKFKTCPETEIPLTFKPMTPFATLRRVNLCIEKRI